MNIFEKKSAKLFTMYSDESEHSESEFYYSYEGVTNTITWLFNINDNENAY
jgi:hypothetical protein